MLNLSTCVKGQKLRLRNGTVVTYVQGNWSEEYPREAKGEDGDSLSYVCTGNYHADLVISSYDVVEILPLETTDTHPSVAWWESCPWITDRKPTEEDGDKFGRVHVKAHEGSRLASNWDTVGDGEPWIHIWHWQPPTLTDREQALKLLDDHRDGWMPTPEQWHVIRKGLEAS